MRRVPLIVSFLLFIGLCASAAYWAMQLFKPPVRPVAAPPRVAQAEIRPDAASSLFGSRKGAAAVASNYQLRGVIFSGNPHDSVAIISADGKPPQAIRADEEVAPGVTIKEVHRDYILLSDGGATKRVDLPESAKGLEGIAAVPTPPRAVPPPPPPAVPTQPIPSRAQAAAAAQAAQQQQATPAVPGLPPGQPAPQVPPVPGTPAAPLTPQNAPSPPVQSAPQPQPVPGQVPASPAMTTAPPATFVNPAPGATPVAPGSTVQPAAPGGAVPSTQPMLGVPTAPAR